MDRICVLLSCMYQDDYSIIRDSNISTDVIVINQCNIDNKESFNFLSTAGKQCHVDFINTPQRGLSNSRNLAIASAKDADICYICDDDELLVDNFEDIISTAYKQHPNADIILFSLRRKKYTYPKHKLKVGIKQLLKTSSVQITFRRDSVINNKIKFDPLMGSGSGNGGGEENKFLMDCKRSHLNIIYLPEIIAEVKTENSQWFHGFDDKYYRKFAWANRRILGDFLSIFYILYWIIFRSGNYEQHLKTIEILKSCFLGYFENRIKKE